MLDLPEDSEDYQIVRQWGTPNIFVTLILYILVRVRGGRMGSGEREKKGQGREGEREREREMGGEEVGEKGKRWYNVGGRRSGMERTEKGEEQRGVN